MHFRRSCTLLLLALALAVPRASAVDEATVTNLQEEVRLLRARLDILEKQLAAVSANQAATTPTGTTV